MKESPRPNPRSHSALVAHLLDEDGHHALGHGPTEHPQTLSLTDLHRWHDADHARGEGIGPRDGHTHTENISPRPSLRDWAKLRHSGYTVERWGDKGWLLRDPGGAQVTIGDHGGVSPTQWEAVAEALHRIDQDEYFARAARETEQERAHYALRLELLELTAPLAAGIPEVLYPEQAKRIVEILNQLIPEVEE